MPPVCLFDNVLRFKTMIIQKAEPRTTPKCFKCQRYMSLLRAANGEFWACDGPHRDGLWNGFRPSREEINGVEKTKED